jgi:hypothetical protein
VSPQAAGLAIERADKFYLGVSSRASMHES